MKEKLEKYVGKKGSILVTTSTKTGEANNLRINVEILDYKESYGKPRWLIKPLSGMGQSWTEQEPLNPTLDQDR